MYSTTPLYRGRRGIRWERRLLGKAGKKFPQNSPEIFFQTYFFFNFSRKICRGKIEKKGTYILIFLASFRKNYDVGSPSLCTCRSPYGCLSAPGGCAVYLIDGQSLPNPHKVTIWQIFGRAHTVRMLVSMDNAWKFSSQQ